MRPIKFRGRVINRKATVGFEADIGDIVTGSLVVYEEEPARRRYWINRQEKGVLHIAYPVDEDSIAQLVGRDKDGREVYEGDELVNERGEIFFAQLINGVLTDEGFLHEIPVEVLKLKEEPKP